MPAKVTLTTFLVADSETVHPSAVSAKGRYIPLDASGDAGRAPAGEPRPARRGRPLQHAVPAVADALRRRRPRRRRVEPQR